MKKRIIGILLLNLPLIAYSADDYLFGENKNLTVTTSGIMIILDTGLPTNCDGSPYGWMLVKQEYSAMTSVLLASWLSNNKSATV